MGIFSRLSDIVNSNINALLDRAEDPEKIVRLIVQEMEDTLVEVRTTAARTIAERLELTRKLEQLEAARDDWQKKAELALAKGREDLARGALVAKARAGETAEHLRRELAAIERIMAKTDDDMAKLNAKLREAKAKQKAIELRRRSAEDRIRVRTQLHDGRIDDALARYSGIERKLDDLEGKAESFDLGHRRSLNEEFAELEAESQIEQELAALKARLNPAS